MLMNTGIARLLAAFICTCAALSVHARDISVKVNGQELLFREIGERELELLDGNYTGELIIPAGVEFQGRFYTVASIGYDALSNPGLESALIPHTVVSICSPFSVEGSSPDSLAFMSRPAHWSGIVDARTFAKMDAAHPDLSRGDSWVRPGYTVERNLWAYNLLVVSSDETGKFGIANYEELVLPCEYDAVDNLYMHIDIRRDVLVVDGFVLCRNGQWGAVDFDGNELLPFKYPSPDKIGRTDEKIEKRIGRAFVRKYGSGAGKRAEEIMDRQFDSQIPYIMYKTGGPMERSFADSLYVPVLDSLISAGEVLKAKDLYSSCVKYFEAYFPEIESLLGKCGALSYEIRDTLGMD